ncbi:TetR/AcrR family transcriptional regulator [Altererythrobacter sp. MF3-039]|uniref:TetR/AcrR family transcriptional regulator n=1 Tax=Altererythrobacter sp. MF3-039 TaxID=3252901 RepID=UPI00390CC578
MNKTYRRSGKIHDELLDAAIRLLEDGDLRDLTVRRIAAEAGVSTMAVYTAFGSRDGVLDALYLHGFEDLAAHVAQGDSNGDPYDRLIAMIDRYIDFWAAQPSRYALMFDIEGSDFSPSNGSREGAKTAFLHLADAYSRAIAKNNSDPSAHEGAFALWALIHGLLSMRGHLPPQERELPAIRARIHRAVEIVVSPGADTT